MMISAETLAQTVGDHEARQAAMAAEITRLQAQAGTMAKALREIGGYTGEGPTYSTPWQEIVRDVSALARDTLTELGLPHHPAEQTARVDVLTLTDGSDDEAMERIDAALAKVGR